jgi:Integrase core domain.
MSTARRPQTDGLTERVNETMQSLLRCYCAEAGYDWYDQLDMIEFQYNSSMSESTQHSPFESTYGFQPPAPVDMMLPAITDSDSAADERLIKLADTQAVVKELLRLSKDRQAARRSTPTPVFQPGSMVYLSTKGLNIRSQNCQKLKDRFIGPYKVLQTVGKTSYKLQLPKGFRLHPVFHVDNLKPAKSDSPLRICLLMLLMMTLTIRLIELQR